MGENGNRVSVADLASARPSLKTSTMASTKAVSGVFRDRLGRLAGFQLDWGRIGRAFAVFPLYLQI
jgi:hypothetical protein